MKARRNCLPDVHHQIAAAVHKIYPRRQGPQLSRNPLLPGNSIAAPLELLQEHGKDFVRKPERGVDHKQRQVGTQEIQPVAKCRYLIRSKISRRQGFQLQINKLPFRGSDHVQIASKAGDVEFDSGRHIESESPRQFSSHIPFKRRTKTSGRILQPVSAVKAYLRQPDRDQGFGIPLEPLTGTCTG